MMAELLGKATGTNKGKGGTMHVADINKGMLGANGVVGSNIPVATGVALSAKVRGSDQVSVVFFGDGASSQGSLHESMNLASIWKLPVIYVCENNRYAEATPFEYSVAGGSVSSRAAGYDMPGVTIDGQSALEVFETAGEAVARARAGEGPTLIEAQTLPVYGPFRGRQPTVVQDRGGGSVLPQPRLHREPQNTHPRGRLRDPGGSGSARGTGAGRGLGRQQVRERKPLSRARGTSRRRVRFVPIADTPTGKARPETSPDGYTPSSRRLKMTQAQAVRQLTYIQAVNEALRQEMERDPTVVIMGEDIAGGAGRPDKQDAWGGPMRLTKGLIGQFGPERIRDTPISRGGIHRGGRGRRGHRPQTGGRPHVCRLSWGVRRPDFQQRRKDALYVRGQSQHTPHDNDEHRRRHEQGRTALRDSVLSLHPLSRG